MGHIIQLPLRSTLKLHAKYQILGTLSVLKLGAVLERETSVAHEVFKTFLICIRQVGEGF